MRGLTAIEILVVISITLVIVMAAFPIYGNLQVSAQLNEVNKQIVQTLRIARENSLNRFGSENHGVKFNPDGFILYQGGSYITRDSSYDREVLLDDSLTLSTNFINDEINFSKGFGIPNTTGVITLIHSVDGTRYVLVNSLGVIDGE